MSKVVKKTVKSKKGSKTNTSLDTLEVTSDFFLSKSHQTLYWSTLRKHSTIQSNLKLIDVAPKVWKDKYWKAYHCKNILLQDGNKLRGSLCRKRWCQCCNRIKTAEMIKGYSKPLQELQKEDDLYLITLTSKTVKQKRLRFEIEKKIKAFTRIKDSLRKNHNIKLIGCRKLEVTYNQKDDRYHPHFHFIQKGKKEAEMLLEYWYRHNPNASEKAQDVRPINANDSKSLIEVFKYATKEVAKDEINAKALHNIYVAIDGKRISQTYGKLRKVKEIPEAKEEINNADFLIYGHDVWLYNEVEKDYFNTYDSKLINTKEITNKINNQNKEYNTNGNHRKRKKRVSKDS